MKLYLFRLFLDNELIELPLSKGVGLVIHRNEYNRLLESYSFSKRLTFRSPYDSMLIN
ncbi:MAG: hypothetical protein KGD63_06885 [Candidatus Lokiarchaeota archaeon]|nr:hypothetical protein [Candidatus Lokiarchaeota archaeon]